MRRILVALMLTFSLVSCGNIFHRHSSVADVKKAVVYLVYQQGQELRVCTGFIVDAAKQLVLTVRHCVPDNEAEVILVDGVQAKVIKRSDTLALVQAKSVTMKSSLIVRPGAVAVGEEAWTSGYGENRYVVFKRQVAILFDIGNIGLDGPLLSGMSGGPVVDSSGRVIGINQAVFFGVVGAASGPNEIISFLAAK